MGIPAEGSRDWGFGFNICGLAAPTLERRRPVERAVGGLAVPDCLLGNLCFLLFERLEDLEGAGGAGYTNVCLHRSAGGGGFFNVSLPLYINHALVLALQHEDDYINR